MRVKTPEEGGDGDAEGEWRSKRRHVAKDDARAAAKGREGVQS